MTPQEKLELLISLLDGGNANRFCERCGISPTSLSRARNGRGSASYFFPRIIQCCPDVRPAWLLSDEGEPLFSRQNNTELQAKIDTLIAEVRRLSECVEKLQEKLTKKR